MSQSSEEMFDRSDEEVGIFYGLNNSDVVTDKQKIDGRLIYKTDVVIVGNGPSGMSVSSFLSGWWPYYNGKLPHPSPWLHEKLLQSKESLLLQDLDSLSEGLEGRSSNPVALLYDSLVRPEADLGENLPSCLQWTNHVDKKVPHIVLGSGQPGGSWQDFDPNGVSLSYGKWMDLPAFSLQEFIDKQRKIGSAATAKSSKVDSSVPDASKRIEVEVIQNYFNYYDKQLGLSPHFFNFFTVTGVRKQTEFDNDYKWVVKGFHPSGPYCFWCKSLVLATGAPIPRLLNVQGETLPVSACRFSDVRNPLVLHSLMELQHRVPKLIDCRAPLALDSGIPSTVMVIGAGLSAADAVLQLIGRDIPVIHVFRHSSRDPLNVLSRLSPSVYPEYCRVAQLMSGMERNPLYTAFSRCCVQSFNILQGQILSVMLSNVQTQSSLRVEVSCAVVLIGFEGDLGFLPDRGLSLTRDPHKPVDAKHNNVMIDNFSGRCLTADDLFAVGPIVGDNFVRYLVGGAFAVSSGLLRNSAV